MSHGEPVAADALRQAIEERHRWPCSVPEYRDSVELLALRADEAVIVRHPAPLDSLRFVRAKVYGRKLGPRRRSVTRRR